MKTLREENISCCYSKKIKINKNKSCRENNKLMTSAHLDSYWVWLQTQARKLAKTFWKVDSAAQTVCFSVSFSRGRTGVNDLVMDVDRASVFMCVWVQRHCERRFFSPLLCVCVCVFIQCSLAAEFPQSIRLHWGLIVSLWGLRDGLL